jgi:putative hydrolase of the HAD superfamily
LKYGRLKAIFFDLDGTLAEDGDSIRQALDVACRVVTRRWPEVDAGSLAVIYRQVSDTAWGDYDAHLRHLVDPEAMLASVWRTALARWNLHDPDVERDAATAYWSYRLQHCRPYPDVFPLVHDLSRNFQLCLLTNGAPAMQRAKVTAAGLIPFFPHVFVGGDFARGKPNQAIFHAALRAANCEPTQAVHIGDSLEHDIAGARNVGVHSVWLNRKGLTSADSPHAPDFEIASLVNLPECLECIPPRSNDD